MKTLKKGIAALLTAAFINSAFAQVSIGGVSVQNAENQRTEIETKYGKFTVKSGYPVERYESGAVKSFYVEDYGGKIIPQLKIPNFGSLYFVTPYPKDNDVLSRINTHPVEFWENGNLKSVYIGDIKYSSLDGDTHLKITLSKYKHKSGRNKGKMETLSVFPKSVIYFYETGELKSFTVAQGQTLQFLRAMTTTDAQRAKQLFKNQSTIELYENGSVKSFTPSDSAVLTYKNPLGLMIAKGTAITLSPEDETVLTSFYPAKGASLSLGSDIVVKLSDSMPVVFYDDGKALKQITWSFDSINFTLGKVDFYSGLNGEAVRQTVYFNEDGSVKTVSGVMTTSFDGEKSLSYYPALVEGKAVNVRQIEYDADGNMTMADLGCNAIELTSEKVKDGVQSVNVWKVYYRAGKKIAAAGNIHLQSSKGNFYDTHYSCIILLDGDSVLQIIRPDGNENISADSNIIFASDGRAVSYTAISPDGNIVEIKIR